MTPEHAQLFPDYHRHSVTRAEKESSHSALRQHPEKPLSGETIHIVLG